MRPAHERAYLEMLRPQGRDMVDLAAARSGGDRFERTPEAMKGGAKCTAQPPCGVPGS
jgi:hypothetical protein